MTGLIVKLGPAFTMPGLFLLQFLSDQALTVYRIHKPVTQLAWAPSVTRVAFD
jgi:hypothetical protein